MNHKLTVIVLTYNEVLHIERCLSALSMLKARVVVVDSFSTDSTCSLAEERGAEVFQNEFVNQALQFKWAMDNCDVSTSWVLRLDADEIIDDELSRNIIEFIDKDGDGSNGAIFHRKHVFMGKWVRFGGRYPLPMLRLFRVGCAYIEQRWMDEHIVLNSGKSCVLSGGFEDNNLNSISWFIDKHNKYATREMIDIMIARLRPALNQDITEETGWSIQLRRLVKQSIYMKLPYFIRPMCYFFFRYFLQLGFLDGARGFAYHFLQGFWYRTLVDVKCMEVDIKWSDCSTDEERLAVLEQLSGYSLQEFK